MPPSPDCSTDPSLSAAHTPVEFVTATDSIPALLLEYGLVQVVPPSTDWNTAPREMYCPESPCDDTHSVLASSIAMDVTV